MEARGEATREKAERGGMEARTGGQVRGGQAS